MVFFTANTINNPQGNVTYNHAKTFNEIRRTGVLKIPSYTKSKKI